MWNLIQIAVYAGLVLGFFALLFVAARHRRERGPAQRLLEASLLLTALAAGGLGLAALLFQGEWWLFLWHRAAQVGLVIVALLTAQFARAFLNRPVRLRLLSVVVALLVLAALVAEALTFPFPGTLNPLSPLGFDLSVLASGLLVLAWLLCMAVAWWISLRALNEATSSKHRNRIRYLLTALLAFTAGDFLILFDGMPALYAGLFLRLLGFGLVTLSLIRYDLPDIRQRLLVVARVALLIAITTGIYLVALLVAGLVTGAASGLPGWETLGPVLLLALLSGAAVDVALGPRLQRWFDRLFLGRVYDVQPALQAYSRQVNLILDLDRLADSTLDWLADIMRVERSSFLLFTLQRGRRVEIQPLRATFGPLPPAQDFHRDSRFVIHFMNIRTPLSQYDLDMLAWFQAMPLAERQWLRDLGADLYVPILVSDEPVALLAVGSREGGRAFSDDDLETLTLLAGQAATAVESARLVDDLMAMQGDFHRLSIELAETNRQLQRLDQTKADFIAIASHELRTPLTQIYGYTDVLSSLTGDELGESPDVDSFVDGIYKGATRLKKVVDAMVDVSLIETGGLTLDLQTIPVAAIVHGAVETVRPAAEQRSLLPNVQDLSHLPDIRADGARLEQVLVGVLSNAIKFSPDGGEIVISGLAASGQPDAEWVDLIVTDSGIGIEREQEELIFEKFYRAESALLHSTDEVRFKGGGPGLGLAIARGIVVAHDGRIWAESPGRDEDLCPGSTITIRLPVAGPRTRGDDG